MKKFIPFILILITLNTVGQSVDTLKPQSVITDATVFFSGAQITRNAKIRLKPGKHLILIDKLPFEINQQSIQVSGIKESKILSVKHLTVIPSSTIKDKKEKDIEAGIKTIEDRIKNLKSKISVYDIEEKILLENSNLSSTETTKTVAEIRMAADFYRERFNEIRQDKLRLAVELENAGNTIKEQYIALNKIFAEKQRAYSQILVLAESEKEVGTEIVISYYIPSAGWEPFYDFRVDDVNKPLSIVYNANVYQSSGEDWKNVKIRLSTSNPSLSGEVPALDPWYLGRPQQMKKPNESGNMSGEIKGKVIDKDTKEPIPFVTVVAEINGKQAGGTTSDFDGNYTLKPLAAGYYNMKLSFVGYQPMLMSGVNIRPNQTTFHNFEMKSTMVDIEAIQITDYKVPLVDRERKSMGATFSVEDIATTVGGVSIPQKKRVITTDYISNTLRTEVANLEYVIEIPYSIPSDGQDYTLRIKESGVPAEYVHHAIPKLGNDVFLMAELTDWSSLNLLSGKSGIYYQGTYVGESYIDAEESSDTLRISLGRDKSVTISREGDKEKFDKKTFGNNIREVSGWKITVRNNKNSVVRLIVEDQYPVSERKSIQVEQLGAPDAKVESTTGRLTWKFELQPGEKKELNFSYSVKYPKYEHLMLD
ncbi:MAG: hypothetical protein CVT94_16190 [Bacteroidetes bacterium HGW-Bacteroidetes-11]|jgi:hypothetical protein|nr:MAG: hypothetical protein CVT94_16190 [Bacteroidetes bacterium HGW-Bacteroidetes-11]